MFQSLPIYDTIHFPSNFIGASFSVSNRFAAPSFRNPGISLNEAKRCFDSSSCCQEGRIQKIISFKVRVYTSLNKKNSIDDKLRQDSFPTPGQQKNNYYVSQAYNNYTLFLCVIERVTDPK